MRERRARPTFDDEALALFVALEGVPMRRRGSKRFKDAERELARKLGLHDEFFFSICSVLDKERSPCWPEYMPACQAWYRVRAVREMLLEAAQSAEKTGAGSRASD
jgi:hypothetical protein